MADAKQSLPIAAALAVVLRGERLLLVRRSHRPDAGRWGFPGGKIEPGETVIAAALRELAEETGVSAEPVEVMRTLEDHDDVEKTTIFGTTVHAVLRRRDIDLQALASQLRERRLDIQLIEPVTPSLEDVFLDVVERTGQLQVAS